MAGPEGILGHRGSLIEVPAFEDELRCGRAWHEFDVPFPPGRSTETLAELAEVYRGSEFQPLGGIHWFQAVSYRRLGRGLLWRASFDVLELIDFSILTNVSNGAVKMRFPAPILPRICVEEDDGEMFLFIATAVASVHRVLLPLRRMKVAVAMEGDLEHAESSTGSVVDRVWMMEAEHSARSSVYGSHRRPIEDGDDSSGVVDEPSVLSSLSVQDIVGAGSALFDVGAHGRAAVGAPCVFSSAGAGACILGYTDGALFRIAFPSPSDTGDRGVPSVHEMRCSTIFQRVWTSVVSSIIHKTQPSAVCDIAVLGNVAVGLCLDKRIRVWDLVRGVCAAAVDLHGSEQIKWSFSQSVSGTWGGGLVRATWMRRVKAGSRKVARFSLRDVLVAAYIPADRPQIQFFCGSVGAAGGGDESFLEFSHCSSSIFSSKRKLIDFQLFDDWLWLLEAIGEESRVRCVSVSGLRAADAVDGNHVVSWPSFSSCSVHALKASAMSPRPNAFGGVPSHFEDEVTRAARTPLSMGLRIDDNSLSAHDQRTEVYVVKRLSVSLFVPMPRHGRDEEMDEPNLAERLAVEEFSRVVVEEELGMDTVSAIDYALCTGGNLQRILSILDAAGGLPPRLSTAIGGFVDPVRILAEVLRFSLSLVEAFAEEGVESGAMSDGSLGSSAAGVASTRARPGSVVCLGRVLASLVARSVFLDITSSYETTRRLFIALAVVEKQEAVASGAEYGEAGPLAALLRQCCSELHSLSVLRWLCSLRSEIPISCLGAARSPFRFDVFGIGRSSSRTLIQALGEARAPVGAVLLSVMPSIVTARVLEAALPQESLGLYIAALASALLDVLRAPSTFGHFVRVAAGLLYGGQVLHVESLSCVVPRIGPMNFLLAEAYASCRLFEKAVDCVIAAAGEMADSQLLSGPVRQEAASGVRAAFLLLGFAQRFEDSTRAGCVRRLCLAALSHVPEADAVVVGSVGGSVVELRAVLWATMFRQAIALRRFGEAFLAVLSIPERVRQYECLMLLVNVMAEDGLLDLFVALPLCEFTPAVETALLAKARAAPVDVLAESFAASVNLDSSWEVRGGRQRSRVSIHEMLYALFCSRRLYVRAADIMHMLVERLDAVEPPQRAAWLVHLRRMDAALLCAINALCLADGKHAWLVRGDDSAIREERSLGGWRRDAGQQARNLQRFGPRIVGVEDLRKRRALLAQRIELMRIDASRGAHLREPVDVVSVLVLHSKFDEAVSLARLFDLDLSPVFAALARQCAAEGLGAYAAQLRSLLAAFDGAATNYAYHSCVVDALLAANPEISIPSWLRSSFLKARPDAFVRLLLKHSRLDDAEECIAAFSSRDSAPT